MSTYVVGPEDVAGQCPKLGDNRGDGGWRSGRAGISGMPGNTDDAVLGQWAGSPRLAASFCEPKVRGVVTNMSRID
jgi:hypothetical protein